MERTQHAQNARLPGGGDAAQGTSPAGMSGGRLESERDEGRAVGNAVIAREGSAINRHARCCSPGDSERSASWCVGGWTYIELTVGAGDRSKSRVGRRRWER